MSNKLKISQETFDDVVRENVEDFGMETSAAISDAVTQFQKQGINLANIDITGGIGREEMLRTLANLDFCIKQSASSSSILDCLKEIFNFCNKSETLFGRNRILLRDKGGINSLHLLLVPLQDDDVLMATLDLLNEVSKDDGNVDYLFYFEWPIDEFYTWNLNVHS